MTVMKREAGKAKEMAENLGITLMRKTGLEVVIRKGGDAYELVVAQPNDGHSKVSAKNADDPEIFYNGFRFQPNFRFATVRNEDIGAAEITVSKLDVYIDDLPRRRARLFRIPLWWKPIRKEVKASLDEVIRSARGRDGVVMAEAFVLLSDGKKSWWRGTKL